MQDYVIKVNGTPISESDFANALQGYSMENYRKTSDQLSAAELSEAKDVVRERLIARELIFQEGLAMGMVADEAAVDEEKQKIVANFPTEEEFYATLEKAGITPLDYHRMIRQDVTVEQMKQRKVKQLPEPGEDEIEQTYREHPERMVRSGRVRAAHILIRTDDLPREEAEQLIEELKQRSQNEPFTQLAMRYSKCPSAPGGGDLGFFRKGDMVKPFEQAAFQLPVGEVGGPVETQFGLHLIKVLEREDDQALSLEEARPKICQLLQERNAARALQQWVEDLKKLAVIEFSGELDVG